MLKTQPSLELLKLMVFPNPRSAPPAAVVFDAYGTLLSNPFPARPFAQLKEMMACQGLDVSDFAHRAMTCRHTLSSLAASYGASFPLQTLARLDAQLMAELLAIRPYPEAERTIRHVLSRGAVVVVASNLAWPYALPIQAALDTVVSRLSSTPASVSRVRTAFSFDLGVVKPSREFYQAVLGSLASDGVEPSRMFMVGDRQVEDVDGPRAAGWSAWRVDRSQDQGLLDAPWDLWLG